MKVQPFYIHICILVPSLALLCQPFRRPHQLLLDYRFSVNLTQIIQAISWCNWVASFLHSKRAGFLCSSMDFFLIDLNKIIIF